MYTTSSNKQAKKIKIVFEDQIANQPSFALKFFAWTTIAEVKKELEKHVRTASSNIRLFSKNLELSRPGERLLDYHVCNRQTIILRMTEQLENSLGIVNPYQIYEHAPRGLEGMLSEVKTGFLSGIKPKLTEYGTSGTYFLYNHARKTVAIFKPFDEEPYAPNNPRGYVGDLGSPGIRRGILSGESATRQVAAFMISDEYHAVPATTYVEFYHPSFEERGVCNSGPIRRMPSIPLQNRKKTKHGSLQSYAEHDDVICNFSSSVFSAAEIHKVAILDIRILNCDRNEENILVKKEMKQVDTPTGPKVKKDYRLIPIDHGLSFPDCFEINAHELVWMDYPQASEPFSEEELAFIDKIDPVEDCQRLKEKLGFRHICLRNFRVAETLLKKCAKAGLTLKQIGMIMYRKEQLSSDEEEPMSCREVNQSQLEKLIYEAENMYLFVKENGIKATVEYQLGLGRPNRTQLQLLDDNSKNRHDDSDDERPLKLLKKQSSVYEKENKRSVSLPQKKLVLKKRLSAKRKIDLNKQETWDEIFFHYFEEVLDRYLSDWKNKGPQRCRLSSIEQ